MRPRHGPGLDEKRGRQPPSSRYRFARDASISGSGKLSAAQDEQQKSGAPLPDCCFRVNAVAVPANEQGGVVWVATFGPRPLRSRGREPPRNTALITDQLRRA